MTSLTTKQSETVSYIKQFVRVHGSPPSICAIGRHFRISKQAASGRVRALEQASAIAKIERPDGIRMSRQAPALFAMIDSTGPTSLVRWIGRLEAGVDDVLRLVPGIEGKTGVVR